MKKLDYRIFIVYLLIIINLFFINFVSYDLFGNTTNTIINPLFWLVICIFCIIFSYKNQQRIASRISKYQIIFIIVLLYLMIYFVQGLFVGYARSPYDRSFIGLVVNIWSYILIIIYQEYVRNILIRNNSSSIIKILSILLFTIIDINLYSFIHIGNDYVTVFKQISSIILPALATNLLMTYLTEYSGFISCLLFRIPIALTNYILPIFPDLNWYFISIERTLLPFITYLSVKNIQDRKTNRTIRKRQKKRNTLLSVIFVVILLLFVGFTAGLYKYKPVAIMSNSMLPLISRGDVVVIEKKTAEELKKLEKYDIIEYVLDNIVVVHRIIAIEEHNDGSVLYITKGDNNNASDRLKVKPEQILGVVSFRIPKVGYPSVWLNDYFNKKNVGVETGK